VTFLQVSNLTKHFPVYGGVIRKPKGYVRACDGISFQVDRGQVFSLVGESGCGKTTAGKCIAGILQPTSGTVELEGMDLAQLPGEESRRLRRRAQMIFQDPYSSLDPRMTALQAIAEGFDIHGLYGEDERRARADALLESVGLQADLRDKLPHEFSGGQRQRIAIARALALEPSLVIADEPVSSLDVSVQAQVVNLFMHLKEQFNLTYIFIAHNLALVKFISDIVGVMYLGELVELGSAREIFDNPTHPYTQALISSVPRLKRDGGQRLLLPGDPPSPLNPPAGCRFHPRCPYVQAKCGEARPPYTEVGASHKVACWRAGD
jgi:oligopeptide/dipeptide ABC transporter ATP-binding protein